MLSALAFAFARPRLASPPLNEHHMIMAHDAATTYLDGGLVDRWAKTQQDGGVRSLLDCGARAFDWRPKLKGGKLIMHHSSVDINYPMGAALDEAVAWAAVNGTSPDDLIVFHSWDCAGDGCDAAARAAFAARNITIIDDCSELDGLTLSEAATRAALPGGGAVLAVTGCLEDHYEPDVACSGYDLEADGAYTCYRNDSSRALPLTRMWNYLGNVSAAGPPADGRLYSHQALWQETDASVAIGVLHGSSLLEDERRSGLNALLSERVADGSFDARRANLVEVNNVCDGGAALLAALRAVKRSS